MQHHWALALSLSVIRYHKIYQKFILLDLKWTIREISIDNKIDNIFKKRELKEFSVWKIVNVLKVY